MDANYFGIVYVAKPSLLKSSVNLALITSILEKWIFGRWLEKEFENSAEM